MATDPTSPTPPRPTVMALFAGPPPPLELSTLIDTARAFLPRLGEAAVTGDAARQLAELDGRRLVALSVAAPVPWAELNLPARTAWWWPQAAEECRRHDHHVIVSLLSEPASPFQGAALVSAVAAAMVGLPGLVALYWGAGRLVHAPLMWRQGSTLLAQDRPPVPLWIDTRLMKGEGDTLGGVTRGLSLFIGRELEIAPSDLPPDHILERLAAFSDYLILHGPVMKDGDTVGESGRRFRVRHGRSTVIDASALLLTLES